MKTIDVRGGSREPAAIIKEEIDRGEAELEVLLDNPVSASGVMRFLESKGFGVQLKDDEGAITITARKREQPANKTVAFKKQPDGAANGTQAVPRPQNTPPCPSPDTEPSGTFSVLITNRALGGDRELGEILMKNFLGALPLMERLPLAVALMNEGVRLALYDSSSCDHLKNLEKKGVSVLICGTCVNYFNIIDQVGAGSISNMPEIIETLNKADRIMTL
jgi:selenium metabolism protein YedF